MRSEMLYSPQVARRQLGALGSSKALGCSMNSALEGTRREEADSDRDTGHNREDVRPWRKKQYKLIE